MMNPPSVKIVSNANDPNVFAIMTFLPSAPMNRNSPPAIWLMQTSNRYCLKNLLKQVRDYKPRIESLSPIRVRTSPDLPMLGSKPMT